MEPRRILDLVKEMCSQCSSPCETSSECDIFVVDSVDVGAKRARQEDGMSDLLKSLMTPAPKQKKTVADKIKSMSDRDILAYFEHLKEQEVQTRDKKIRGEIHASVCTMNCARFKKRRDALSLEWFERKQCVLE